MPAPQSQNDNSDCHDGGGSRSSAASTGASASQQSMSDGLVRRLIATAATVSKSASDVKEVGSAVQSSGSADDAMAAGACEPGHQYEPSSARCFVSAALDGEMRAVGAFTMLSLTLFDRRDVSFVAFLLAEFRALVKGD